MLFDFTKCESVHFSGIRLNKEGIPERVGFKKLGYFSYPVTVSQYGIYQLQLYKKTHDEFYRESAIRCAKYLIASADIQGEKAIWWHNFKNDLLKIEPPWLCGLSQGFSAWLLFSLREVKREWEEIAYKALEPFFCPVEKGGLSNQIDDYFFLEEYPSKLPSATLNGFMYILLVLHAFSEAGYSKAEDLFSTYTKNLTMNLDRYDVGYWSLYDLWAIKRLASLEYHWLHLYQLDSLYSITGIEKFRDWHDKWLGYWMSSNSRFFRLINKVKEKLYITFKT